MRSVKDEIWSTSYRNFHSRCHISLVEWKRIRYCVSEAVRDMVGHDLINLVVSQLKEDLECEA